MSRAPLILALSSLMGCAAHRSGEVVRSIDFAVEGRPFPSSLWATDSNRALRAEMSQRTSSWQSRMFPGAIEPRWLNRARLDDDAKSIESFLAEQGYFDAKFIRWEVTSHGSERRVMRPVTIRGTITEGEPSRIRKVEIEGLDGLRARLQRKLRSASSAVPGKIFVNQDYTATIAALQGILLDSGYAFVSVTGSADAYPEEHAVDVSIKVDTGPRCRFGPVVISGVFELPKEVVADTVTFKEGDLFSQRDLAETRSALFGLRVFSVVNVTPSASLPPTLGPDGTAVVPVRIEVRRTRLRRIKLGPGIELESGKGTLYGSAEWEHTNLMKRLWNYKQTARIGVAGVATQDMTYTSLSLSDIDFAPVGELGAALGIPHIIGPKWSFDIDGNIEVGVETGYRFLTPVIAPAMTWRPLRRHGRDRLSVAFGYQLRYFNYFDFTVEIKDIVESPLGLDLTDPYLLSMLDQRLIWDGRNDLVAPTRGWYGSLAMAEAGGLALGNFNFIRSQAELRGYRAAPAIAKWKPGLVIAARVGAGVIEPYGTGPEASVPYAERLYLGGGTTVRGWGDRSLGPTVATRDNITGEEVLVPAGGLFDAFGNLELRKAIGRGFGVVAFTDVGRVWPSFEDFSMSGLQWSVGGGLRYATVIGPIRCDVGVRAGPETSALPETPGWAIHFGLSEAF